MAEFDESITRVPSGGMQRAAEGGLQRRVHDLGQRGEVERLRNMGKLLGIVHDVVKAGKSVVDAESKTKVLRAEGENIEKEITAAVAKGAAQIKDGETTRDMLRDHSDLLQRTIREDLPAIMELLGDGNAQLKADVVRAALDKLPTMVIKR